MKAPGSPAPSTLRVGSLPAAGLPILSYMIRIQRIVLVVLMAVLALSVAAPALAAGEGEASETETTDTTTVAAVPISEGGVPAVVIPPAEIEALEYPWTDRFLIPLLVVTAVALVVGVAIAYDRTIRHRYQVVS